LALMPPVPRPIMTIAVTSPPNAAPDLIEAGVAVATRTVRPTI